MCFQLILRCYTILQINCSHIGLLYFTAYYRFQRKEIFNTFVTNVYAFCGNNEFCALKSTATKTELPIEKSYHNIPLNAESDCVVNFVEIIHDCVPRRVDLKFIFKSPTESDNLYLKVKD